MTFVHRLTPRSFPRHGAALAALATLVLAVPSGCVVDDEEEEDDAAETGDGDGDGDGDHELGSTPNLSCLATVSSFATVLAAAGTPEADETIREAYLGTAGIPALREFVWQAGAYARRVDGEGVLLDDAALIELLANPLTPATATAFEQRLRLVASAYVRALISDVSSALPDPERDPALLHADWDAAYCFWDGMLRDAVIAADAASFTGYDTIEADTLSGFELGNVSVEGPTSWAPDEFFFGAAKQVVEKSGFTAAHRNVLTLAAQAAEDGAGAELLAARALGQFQLLEDRVAGRNTPGIAIIEEMLSGDVAAIDVSVLEEEMNVAFAKRTRKYASHAVDEPATSAGTAKGVTGAYEGRTYAKLIAYDVAAKVNGVSEDAFLAEWDTYVTAVEDGDQAAVSAASSNLVTWVCEYQAALGIAECTDSVDEVSP